MTARRVAITGAAGLIGRTLTEGMRDAYDVTGFDRRRKNNPGKHASLARMRALVSTFRGADTVIHLAGDPRLNASWRSVLWNNVVGTRNVLEAARRAGVRRVVYASSNAVTAGHERDEPWASVIAGHYGGLDASRFPRINAAMPVRPANPYGVSKVFGEATCRYYSDRHGISAICVRIGTVTQDGEPRNVRQFATFLSHADLVRLFVACIDAPDDVRFAIVYGASANTWGLYDVSGAAALGYTSRDNAEAWRAATPEPER